MMSGYTKDNIHYAHPVTVRDGRVRYNRTLDNYFNAGIMDKVLDSFKPRDNHYNTVAHTWDLRHLLHTQGSGKERPRYFDKVIKDSHPDMKSSWNKPGYCPRRSSSEETHDSGPVKLPVYTPSPYCGDDTRSRYTPLSFPRGYHPYEQTPSLDYRDDTKSIFSSSSIRGSYQDMPSLDYKGHTRSTCSFSSIRGRYQDTPSLDCKYNTRLTPSSSIRGRYLTSDADVEPDDRGYSTNGTKTLQPHPSIQNLPIVPACSLPPACRSNNTKNSFAYETETDDGYQDASAQMMTAQKRLGFDISCSRSTQQRVSPPPGPPAVSYATSSAGDPDMMPIPPPSVNEFHGASVRPQHATEEHVYPSHKNENKSTFTAKYGSDDVGCVRPTTAKSPKQTLFPCLLDDCNHVATSLDDLARHHETTRHPTPEYECFGCYCAYNRNCDLLRHHRSKPTCKKAHEAVLVTC